MTAIRWAKTVRCDYPGCDSEAGVTLSERWPDREMPEGWLDLRAHHLLWQPPRIVQVGGSPGGPLDISELCPVHARMRIGDLMQALEEETGDGNNG